MELVFRAFLLWFTIYTLSVCPQDEHLKSPVCRGLAEYRRLVIEPYILPSIEHALAHPSVAPYVEKAKPYADYAVRTAKPIAARAQKEFDTRVVPQWKKRVVPFYYQHAVPQLLKLDAQTAPYRTRVEQDYERLVAPYVRRIVAALNQGQRKARPYVALAAGKSYQGYQYARPYARPVWEKVKAILAQLAAILGEQRRQFVDPHVKKIWEHVKEMSNGKPQSPSASQLRNAASSKLSKANSQISQASAKISSTLSSVTSSAASRSSAKSSSAVSSDKVVSSVISEAVSSSEAPAVVQATEAVKSSVAVAADKVSDAASSVSDAVESTASAVSSSASSAISSASDTVAASSSSLASAASSAVHASAESASSVAEAVTSVVSTLAESASAAVFDAPSEAGSALSSEATSLADEAGSSASSGNLISSSAADVASVTAADADASGSEAAESTPSVVAYSEEQTSADVATDASSDPDLDLLAELGLTEDFLEGRDTGEAPVQHEQTEEEREEELRLRKEKNARDRAALLERHVAWEVKVEDLIAENKKAVHDLIVASRKAALTELKLSVEIAKEIEGLVEDADKFLRGAEKYMANLQKESRKQDEKRTVWDRVVGKLEDKFSDRLRQTEGVVNGWYQSLLEKEAAEVRGLHRLPADRWSADGLYLADQEAHDRCQGSRGARPGGHWPRLCVSGRRKLCRLATLSRPSPQYVSIADSPASLVLTHRNLQGQTTSLPTQTASRTAPMSPRLQTQWAVRSRSFRTRSRTSSTVSMPVCARSSATARARSVSQKPLLRRKMVPPRSFPLTSRSRPSLPQTIRPPKSRPL